MANCNDLFIKFDQEISLRPTEIKFLRKARASLTKKIKKSFSNTIPIPIEFKVQGSFTMNTIIRPLNSEFDIDVGILFKFPTLDKYTWPLPQTVSKWVFDAVNGHTSIPSENKATCVRVTYKPINSKSDFGYHVDFPIYGEYESIWGNRYKVIGLNNDRKWSQKSDPSEFSNWFDSKCKKNTNDRKQLIRIVKYLKAWKDFQSADTKMPSGIVLTILAAKNYVPNDRDDIVLYKLLDKVYSLLWWDFSIMKPTMPENDLVENYSASRKKNFMKRLRDFRDGAEAAISTNDKSEAIEIWRCYLGDRFGSEIQSKVL